MATEDPAGDGDQGDGGSDPAAERPARTRWPSAGSVQMGDGAGWVLGLLLYGWVVLPFFKGGPAGVKKVLKAKFLNKSPDGSWLP